MPHAEVMTIGLGEEVEQLEFKRVYSNRIFFIFYVYILYRKNGES